MTSTRSRVSRSSTKTENPQDERWRFAQEGAAFTGLPDENTHPTEVAELQRNDRLAVEQEPSFLESAQELGGPQTVQQAGHVERLTRG